jgi:hypothetical protein
MPPLVNPALWRATPYSYRGYLYLHKPAAVLTATVSAVPAAYPLAQMTVTVTGGSPSAVQPGMTVLFGSAPGRDDLGRTRARGITVSLPTATLFIARASRGTRDGEVNVSAGVHVTVLNEYRVWAKLPRINARGVTFKDGDTAFSAASAQPPVANGGAPVAGFVNPATGLLAVSFDATGSYAVAPGATLTAYQWTFPGATPPVASTAVVSGVQFPPGFRYCSLTVTDSGGRQHTCRVPVFAAERTGTHAPLARVEVERDRLLDNGAGHEMAFTVYDSIDAVQYPDGTLALYWEEEVYGATPGSLAGPAGREAVKFAGFVDGIPQVVSAERDGLMRAVTLDCADVAGRLRRLPAFPQVVTTSATPTRWEQMASANVDRYAHYLLHWHSTALDLTDFTPSGLGAAYPFRSLSSDGGNLFAQLDTLAQNVGCRFTSDMRGRLAMRRDPLLLDAGARPAITIVSLDESDWTRLEVETTRHPRVHWLNTGGIVASAAAPVRRVFAVAPGVVPGQGEAAEEDFVELVASQAELNSRTGHRYARVNAPHGEFTLTLTRGGEAGIDPALLEWVRLTVSPATAAQRGLAFTDERFLVVGVETEHDGRVGAKTVTLRLERETVGLAAITVTPPTPARPAREPARVVAPSTGALPAVELARPPANITQLAGVNTDGHLYITNDAHIPADAGGPTWTRTALAGLGLVGTPRAFAVDPFSPLYLGTGSAVNGWLATDTHLYRLTNVFGVPALALQHTFGSDTAQRTLVAARGVGGWVLCASYSDSFGTRVARTTDGATWTEVSVTTAIGTAENVHSPQLHLSPYTPGLALVGAYSATDVGRLYVSTDYGATWALRPRPDNFGLARGGSFHIPFADRTETRMVYTRRVAPNTLFTFRLEADGVTQTDITPAPDRAPRATPAAIAACDAAREYVVGVFRPADNTVGDVYTSVDSGTTWTLRAAGTDYHQVLLSGRDPDVVRLYGYNGAIAFSDNFCAIIDDRRGNIAGMTSPAPDRFIGLCAGVGNDG